jgi:Arc/MetJ-type ribon-helix-helix transcriptional regulator
MQATNIQTMLQKKRVDVIVSDPYIEGMEILMKAGLYVSQSEIMKDALRRLLLHYGIPLVREIRTV